MTNSKKHEQIQAIKERLNEAVTRSKLNINQLTDAINETNDIEVNYGTVNNVLNTRKDALDLTTVIAICRYLHLDTAMVLSRPGTKDTTYQSNGSFLDSGNFTVLDDPKYFGKFHGFFYSPNHKSPELIRFELEIVQKNNQTTATMHYHGRPTSVEGKPYTDPRILYGTPYVDARHSTIFLLLTNETGDFYFLYFNWQNIVKITKPTKVKKIYIPQLSFVKFEYYSVQYLKMFETVCRNSKSFEQWNGKDVYFTREAYSHGLKAKDFGLKTIKKNFAVNGFVCVEPQNLSLEEQISIWNNTRTVACINGSIPLNLLFCQNPHVNVVVCNKTNREHENLRIIESITNHRVLYIDVYDPKYTNKEFSLGQGPFLCTMTDQFKKYLSDHNMVYASESPIERIYAIIRFDLVCLYRFVKGD